MSDSAKTWFITGISRGLGREFASQLLARGDRVIGTTRDGHSDIAAPEGSLVVLALDVTDGDAVREVIDAAFATGPVDVILNNAGYGLMGSIENATEAEIDQVMDVNFHGPRRVIQAALPHLRRQRGGHIVNITSIAGIAAGAGSGFYAAAKYALEGLSQSLVQEVAPLGIKVTCVEPGAFRTDFLTDQSLRTSPDMADDYSASAGATLNYLAKIAGSQPGDPRKAVQAVIQMVEAPKPPLHLVLGPDAIGRTDAMLKAFAADLDAWRSTGMGTNHQDQATG
ncbi:short-chain dehydrogenase [Devosia riboflavina]|uniref:Short-chain dehydrogenase n=1 Tax=Devosia riboflavina TaxID=46914 RepID=A0A087LY70_9HYPH|nr:SDR family NAD(P)-dependent oxidoreductase [Devosia riboflavina]KFL29573.1 short-chain dehydrogenase [Devosia riboflavina]